MERSAEIKTQAGHNLEPGIDVPSFEDKTVGEVREGIGDIVTLEEVRALSKRCDLPFHKNQGSTVVATGDGFRIVTPPQRPRYRQGV